MNRLDEAAVDIFGRPPPICVCMQRTTGSRLSNSCRASDEWGKTKPNGGRQLIFRVSCGVGLMHSHIAVL